MAALSHTTRQEADCLICTTSGSKNHYHSNEPPCTTHGAKPEPLQFTDLPVEIKELIYEQLACMSRPFKGTVDAVFAASNRSKCDTLSNCLPAVCSTNKRERFIASRVFIRNRIFRIYGPERNLDLRHFFDGLPKNVGYGSVTAFKISSSCAFNDAAWSWEHEMPSLDVELMRLCPNLRTLAFSFRLYFRMRELPASLNDGFANNFQDVFECKNLSTINIELFSTRHIQLFEGAHSSIMELAKWLQEGFLRRNGIKLVMTIDWNHNKRWVYTWRTSCDLGRLSYSLIQQEYVDLLNEYDTYSLREPAPLASYTPKGEAVEVLHLSLDDTLTKN